MSVMHRNLLAVTRTWKTNFFVARIATAVFTYKHLETQRSPIQLCTCAYAYAYVCVCMNATYYFFYVIVNLEEWNT